MAYTISKFRNSADSSSTDLDQRLADIRYVNQNFEETLIFNTNFGGNRLTNLGDAINQTDAVSKKYITTLENRVEDLVADDDNIRSHVTFLENTDITHNSQILALQTRASSIETQNETQNIRLGDHDLAITTLYNSLAHVEGNNFFAARFYKETSPGLWTFAYFLTSTLLHDAGDIGLITTQYNSQVGFKLGTASTKRHYLLKIIASCSTGVCTLKLFRNGVGIKLWKEQGGNANETMDYSFSCLIFDVHKGDEFHFQYWNSPAEWIINIEFVMIAITSESAL